MSASDISFGSDDLLEGVDISAALDPDFLFAIPDSFRDQPSLVAEATKAEEPEVVEVVKAKEPTP